jgi:hypothetical protein
MIENILKNTLEILGRYSLANGTIWYVSRCDMTRHGSRPFGFAIRMLEYKDLQSEPNHSDRIINPYTPIRRITNPAIEPILRQYSHAIHLHVCHCESR